MPSIFQLVFCPHLCSETRRDEGSVFKSDWAQGGGGGICLASPGSSPQTFLHLIGQRDDLP